MKYDTLKALVNAKVYENTEQRITGGDMNDVLQSAIASLGAHYQMGGLVSPTDHITVGDEPVVFIATTPGTYTYFGSQVVADGEVALLVWSGTAWSKQTPDIATRTEVSQLRSDVTDYMFLTKIRSEVLSEYEQVGTNQVLSNVSNYVGQNVSQIPFITVSNNYVVKIPIGDYKKIKFRVYASPGGNGSVITDEDGVVISAFTASPNSYDTIIDVPSGGKYLYYSVGGTDAYTFGFQKFDDVYNKISEFYENVSITRDNVIATFPIYAMGKMLLYVNSYIGQNVSQIPQGPVTGCNTVKIPILGFNTISFRVAGSGEGNGSVITDENGIILVAFTAASAYNTTIEVPENGAYFYYAVFENSSYTFGYNAPVTKRLQLGLTQIQTYLGQKVNYTDAQCVQRFIQEMNNVATIVGMENSVYYEPAGYPNTANTTKVADLMKLGIYASGLRKINDAWGRRTATIQVYGPNARTINLTGPSDNDFEQGYDILGWKPGLSEVYGTNTWIMIVQSKTTKKNYVVGEYDLDNNPSTRDYPQIKSALDYVDGVGSAPSLSNGAICVCELPKETPSLFSRIEMPLLFSYNIGQTFLQASTTKVMSLVVASIYGINDFRRVELKTSDIQSGLGVPLAAGDILTVRDLFLCAMLSSSNTATYAIARVVGEKLLTRDNFLF